MRPEELHSAIERLLAHSPAFPGESLVIDLIANPRAGGFTRPTYAKKRLAELAELEERARDLPLRPEPVTVNLRLTERSGHASDIARSIAAEARGDPAGLRRIILTAGGDGTSLETASVLAALSPDERSRLSLVRLPFGTGNDGSEGRELDAALGRFLGPLVLEERPALRVLPNPAGGKAALYAFNIASVGLDAFVCHMTNKLKTTFPGDSYKLWVDLSSVLYDRIWPPSIFKAKAFGASGEVTATIEDRILLFAVGVTGHRSYGSNKPILPDDDNACAVLQMPLLKKLALKGRISSGGHRGLDVVRLFSGMRFELDYPTGILLQCDGEVVELTAADFPLVMEVTEPLYNVAVRAKD
jgi:diacylglycerol kinase family enzyme